MKTSYFLQRSYLLIFLTMLFTAPFVRGQDTITTSIVSLATPVIEALDDELICHELAFTLDLEFLNSLIKSKEDNNFLLQLNIGTQYQFDLDMKEVQFRSPSFTFTKSGAQGITILPKGSSSIYRGTFNGDNSSRTRIAITDSYFRASFSNDLTTYTIEPLSYEGHENIWLLCTSPTIPETPETPIPDDCTNPIMEVALEGDNAFFKKMNEDSEQALMFMSDVAELAFTFYEEKLGLKFEVVNCNIRKDLDDYCCADIPIAQNINSYYRNRFPCLKKDAIMGFIGKTLYGGGGQAGASLCEDDPDNVPVGYVELGPLSVERQKIAFAHELGHILGANELEVTSCSAECSPTPLGSPTPIMCTGGINPQLILSSCSRPVMEQTIELNCNDCLFEVEEQPNCSHCFNSVTMTASNHFPVADCGTQELITYTIEVCSDCDGENAQTGSSLDIQVIYDGNSQQFIDEPGSPFEENTCRPSGASNTYLCIENEEFAPQECRTFQFTTEWISSSGGNGIEVQLKKGTINESNASIFLTPVDPVSVIASPQGNPLSSFIPSPIDNEIFACLQTGNPNTKIDLEIEGTLIIDRDYCFLDGSNLIMRPNAAIIVQSGHTLRIENSRISSCTDMWKHITVQNGATLIVKKSVIEDAETAIVAEPGAHLIIRDSEFTNNFIGLEITGAITFDEAFEGNLFQADGFLKSPRNGQIAKTGVRADNAGFIVFGSTGVDAEGLPDAPNQFIGLKKGMILKNSQPVIINAAFQNIYVGGGSGRAITSSGNFPAIIGNDQANEGIVSFQSCEIGVYNSQSALWVRNTLMADLDFGIRAFLNQNQSINITNNSINEASVGVDLLFNGNSSVLVDENSIGVGPNGTAIRVQEFSTSGNYRIENNTINMTDGQIGIFHRGGNKAQIKHNTINVNGGLDFEAIRLESGDSHEVSCNLVAGPGTIGTGILLQNTPGLSLQCNSVNNTALGINFWGINDGTQMEGNTFGDHEIGFLMGMLPADGNAVIGNQVHHGNLWAGNYSSGFGARHLGDPTTVSQSFFFVDAVENPLFTTTVDASFNWFLGAPNSTPSFECSVSGSCPNGPGTQFVAPPVQLNKLDYTIAKGELAMDTAFQSALQWTAATHLYKRLEDFPHLLEADSIIKTFKTKQSISTIGLLQELKNGIKTLLVSPDELAEELEQNASIIVSHLDKLLSLKKALSSNPGDVKSAQISAQMNEWMLTLNALNIERKQLLDKQKKSMSSLQATLLADNSAIPTDEIYQDNFIWLNDIYLKTIVKGNDQFTNTQAKRLFAIAQQCPLAGGEAVWLARSLYTLIDDQVRYDDQALCSNYRNHEKQNSVSEEQNVFETAEYNILLHPNPAKEQVWINYDLENYSTTVAKVIIYDILGNEVFSDILPMNQTSHLMNIASLNTGTYFCTVYLDNQIIQTEKLLIIK